MARLKNIVRQTFRSAGFDIIHHYDNPEVSYLGLKKLSTKTIFDIGANCGQSAKAFRLHFPEANIYCFEPLTKEYSELNKWAKTQCGKVITFNTALGNKTGTVDFNLHTEYSPSSSILETTNKCSSYYPQTLKQKKEVVPIAKLDDLTNNLVKEKQILVKIDVQGFESEVIKGAKEVLLSATACMLEISLSPLYFNQSSFPQLVKEMNGIGLHYAGNLNQTYSRNGNVIFIDALFVRDNNPGSPDKDSQIRAQIE